MDNWESVSGHGIDINGRRVYNGVSDLGTKMSDEVPRVSGISDEPIPNEFMFDQWEQFLFRIPESDYQHGDELEFLTKHYEKVETLITEATKFTTEALDKVTSEAYRLQKEPAKPKRKAWLLNEELGRKYLALHSVKINLCVELYKQRIPIHKKILEILMRLSAILSELKRCPRRIGFITPEITEYVHSYRQYERDFRLSEQIRAVTFGMDELKDAIRVLSYPFVARGATKQLLLTLLENMTKLYDPNTCYLCETDDFAQFSYVLQKRMNVFIEESCDFESMTLAQRIMHVSERIVEVLALTNENEKTVLGLCVARFWFRETMAVNEVLSKPVLRLEERFRDLRDQKLRDLLPPNEISLDLSLTPREFFQSNPMLTQIDAILLECLFQYCPSDVARIVNLVQLRFAAFAASILHKSIEDRAINPFVMFLWKILYISSPVPFHRCIIFAEAYMRISVYKGTLFRSCQVAYDALRLFPEFTCE